MGSIFVCNRICIHALMARILSVDGVLCCTFWGFSMYGVEALWSKNAFCYLFSCVHISKYFLKFRKNFQSLNVVKVWRSVQYDDWIPSPVPPQVNARELNDQAQLKIDTFSIFLNTIDIAITLKLLSKTLAFMFHFFHQYREVTPLNTDSLQCSGPKKHFWFDFYFAIRNYLSGKAILVI